MFTFPVFSTAIAIKKKKSYFFFIFALRSTATFYNEIKRRFGVEAQRNRTDLRLRVSVGFYNHGSYSWYVLLLDWIFQSCLTTDREAFATKSNGGLKGKPVCFKYLDFFLFVYIKQRLATKSIVFSNLHDSKINRSHSRVTGKETKNPNKN